MAEGATSMITSAISNVTTVFNAAVTMITGNEVIASGIGLFRCLTHR